MGPEDLRRFLNDEQGVRIFLCPRFMVEVQDNHIQVFDDANDY